MARFPRTLGDAIAAQAEAARSTRTSVMGVDPLAPISLDQLDTVLIDDLERRGEEIDQLNIDLVNAGNALDQLNTDLAANNGALTDLNSELLSLQSEIGTVADGVDAKIADAINDYDAQPLTDDRFTDASLTVWPFVNGAIPQGALAPGSIGSSDIADFALTVKKIKSDRHHLY